MDGALERKRRIEIKKIDSSEWESLRTLRLRAVKEEPEAFGRTFEEEQAIPEADWKKKIEETTYLGARDGKELVGTINIVRQKGEKLKHWATIYSVYVIPEQREGGVGRQLMEKAIQELKETPGIIKAVLYVCETQKTAITLYESLGFQPVGAFKKEMQVDGQYYDIIAYEIFFDK